MSSETRKSSMREYEPRVVPWRFKSDLDELSVWFYPNKSGAPDMRREGVARVKCWSSRGPYVPHTVESTAHLTDAKLTDEQGITSDIPLQLSYTMAMIRFVNGLLDPTQQSQFAIPLHVLAERMGLPSWFVELRHCGTHEREMPSLEMLRMATDQALDWLWDNYWNAEPEQEFYGESAGLDSERATPDSVVDSQDIDRVLRKIPSISNLLASNRDLWKLQRVSSTFTGEQDARGPPIKKSKKEENPEERLERFVVTMKDAWKSSRGQRDVFLEKFMRKYRSHWRGVLELLAHRIHSFGFDLSRWILENYELTLKSGQSPLREIFDGPQLQKVVSQVCEHALDEKKMIMDWTRWCEMLRNHPNWIALQIVESCDARNSSANEKFRKRHHDEIRELKGLLQRFKTCVTSSDLTMYQIASVTKNSIEVSRGSPFQTSANEILQDLQKLKQAAEPKSFKWEPVPQWTPRPFGQV